MTLLQFLDFLPHLLYLLINRVDLRPQRSLIFFQVVHSRNLVFLDALATVQFDFQRAQLFEKVFGFFVFLFNLGVDFLDLFRLGLVVVSLDFGLHRPDLLRVLLLELYHLKSSLLLETLQLNRFQLRPLLQIISLPLLLQVIFLSFFQLFMLFCQQLFQILSLLLLLGNFSFRVLDAVLGHFGFDIDFFEFVVLVFHGFLAFFNVFFQFVDLLLH